MNERKIRVERPAGCQFDERKADRAIQFIQQYLTHGQQWVGRPFKLAPWQEHDFREVFGRVDSDGNRLVRTVAPGLSGTRESTIAVANNGNVPSVGNGAAEVELPFAGTLQAQYILSALVNMVDITVAVETYAKAKGREIHFSTEDIRALTITCFIQRARENGGTR